MPAVEKNRLPRQNPNSAGVYVGAIILGCALALALGSALAQRGFVIDAAGLQRLILAHSFTDASGIFWTRVRWDYLFGDVVDHAELLQRPLWPLLLAGWRANAARGATWCAVPGLIGCAALLPIWLWAIAPQFTVDRRRGGASRLDWILAGIAGYLVLIVCGGDGLLGDLRAGGFAAAAAALTMAAYGAANRERWATAGVVCGALFYLSSDGELLAVALALGLGLERALAWRDRRATAFAGAALALVTGFVLVTAPWAARTWVAGDFGASPFLTDLSRAFLQGRQTLSAWHPATGTGLATPGWGYATVYFHSIYVHSAWDGWVKSLTGEFVAEALPLSVAWAAAVWLACRRPRLRRLGAVLAVGAAVWTAALAGWCEAAEPRAFIALDALGIAALTGLMFDRRRSLAWASRGLAIFLVAVNSGAVEREIRGLGVAEDLTLAAAPPLALLARYVPTNEAVLRGRTEGLRAVEAGDAHPVAILPSNFREPGVLDRFVDRLHIRWTTQGAAIQGVLTKHRLERRDGEAGTTLWEIRPAG